MVLTGEDGQDGAVTAGPDPGGSDPEFVEERPGEAIFEGAATGGVIGAVVGWLISVIAKRRRERLR